MPQKTLSFGTINEFDYQGISRLTSLYGISCHRDVTASMKIKYSYSNILAKSINFAWRPSIENSSQYFSSEKCLKIEMSLKYKNVWNFVTTTTSMQNRNDSYSNSKFLKKWRFLELDFDGIN